VVAIEFFNEKLCTLYLQCLKEDKAKEIIELSIDCRDNKREAFWNLCEENFAKTLRELANGMPLIKKMELIDIAEKGKHFRDKSMI
jgi:hypothetical protein